MKTLDRKDNLKLRVILDAGAPEVFPLVLLKTADWLEDRYGRLLRKGMSHPGLFSRVEPQYAKGAKDPVE